MNAIVQTINTSGRAFAGFAAPMLIQSGLLILILLAVDAVLRKRVRAVFRYWIWMLVLVKLVLPPSLWSPVSLGTWFGDTLDVPATALLEPEPLQLIEAPPAVASILSPPNPLFVEPPVPPPAAASPRSWPAETRTEKETGGKAVPIDRPVAVSLNWQGLVLLIWGAVVAALLLLLAQRAFFVQGLVAQADEASRTMLSELDQCRQRLGLQKQIGLRLSPNATTPAVCGLRRPVILIPQNLASRLRGDDLQAVLFHELAHIKRGDLWINLAQTLLQILYFYNPLLWLANAIIRRIREKAVDETVLVAMGESAPQYPQILVNVAKLALARRPALSLRLIGVVESKSALTSRIKHILNRPLPKTTKLGILGCLLIITIATVLLPMAKARPIADRGQKAVAQLEEQQMTAEKESASSSDFTAVLPNGVTVELLGVCEHPSAGKPWRRPNGERMPIRPYDRLVSTDISPAWKHYEVLFRLQGAANEVITKLKSGYPPIRSYSGPCPVKDKSWAQTSASQGAENLFSAVLSVEPYVNQVQLDFGVGMENAWETRGRLEGRIDSTSVTVPDAMFGPAIEKDGRTSLTVAHRILDREIRLIAIDKNGVVHKTRSSSNRASQDLGSCQGEFDLPLADIASIQLQTQKLTWVTFQNIPLDPSPVSTDKGASGGALVEPENDDAILGFRIAPKLDEVGSEVVAKYKQAFAEGGRALGSDFAWFEVRPGTILPADQITCEYGGKTYMLLWNDKSHVMLKDQTWRLEDVRETPYVAGNRAITLTMDETGVQLLHKLGDANLRHCMAVVFEGRVIAVPFISTPLSGRGLPIIGRFTTEEVGQIIATLKRGMAASTLSETASQEISGVVVDSDGNPISDAGVIVENKDLLLFPQPVKVGSRMRRLMREDLVRTDATGRFAFTGLNPGVTDLCVRAEQYRTESLRAVATGTTGLRVMLGKPQPYQLSGTVVDGQGKPLGDVEVLLLEEAPNAGKSEDNLPLTVRTDAAGAFRFDKTLQPSVRHTLLACKPGRGLWGKELDATGGETFVRITMLPGEKVSGTVVNELGEPVPNATVVLCSCWRQNDVFRFPAESAGLPPRAVTGPDGSFTLEQMPTESDVFFLISANGYESGLTRAAQTGKFGNYGVRTGDGRTTEIFCIGATDDPNVPLKITLHHGVTLRGSIVYEDAGKPAKGIRVETQAHEKADAHGPAGWAEATTDDAGQFELKGVSPTPCNVLVMLDGPEKDVMPDWAATAVSFDALRPGETRDGIKLVLTKGGIIRGKVTDAGGHPLKGIDIAFYSTARPESGAACQYILSRADGTWAYRFPPGGVYVYIRTSFSGSHWQTKDYRHTLTAGQIINGVDFTLDQTLPESSPYRSPTSATPQAPSSGVSGRVVDPNGNPVLGAQAAANTNDKGAGGGALVGPEQSEAKQNENRLKHLLAAAQPGSVVVVPAGRYTTPVEIAKPVVLQGETQDNCIIEVTADRPAISINTQGQGQVTVENLTIRWQLATDKKTELPSALLVKDTNALIRNCRFAPLGDFKRSPMAVYVDGRSKSTVANCRFSGFEYVICYGQGTEGAVQDCIITDCGHQGVIGYDGSTLTVQRNIITGSKFHAVRCTGGILNVKDNLLIKNANRAIYLGNRTGRGTITNNLIVGNGTGISAFGRADYVIANNVIVDNSFSGIDMRDSCRLSIRNNVLAKNQRGLALFKEGTENFNVVAPNVFWANATDAESLEKPADSVTADPQFADPNHGDFTRRGPAQTQGHGLSDPQVLKDLWKRYEQLQREPSTRVDATPQPPQTQTPSPSSTVLAWQRTDRYVPPDPNGFFPDDPEAGKELDVLFRAGDRDGRSDEEILSTARRGFRRTTHSHNSVLQWIGNHFIWGKQPQNPEAIEIMYHAVPLERHYAIYSGLSVVKNKSPNILYTLAAICMQGEEVGRITWGIGAQREQLLSYLTPYLHDKDPAKQEMAAALLKHFQGELDFESWLPGYRVRQGQIKFGPQLAQFKETLLSGGSEPRYQVLITIGHNQKWIEMLDESFVPVLQTVSTDPDPRVRNKVASAAGYRWLWVTTTQPQDPTVIELMLKLSADSDREVRYNAVYYGLSAVRDKSEPVVRRLIRMAVTDQQSELPGRIAWSLKNSVHVNRQLIEQSLAAEWESVKTDAEQAAIRRLYKDVLGQEPPAR